MEFPREKSGPLGESLGKTRLYVNDKVAAEGDMKTQAGKFTLRVTACASAATAATRSARITRRRV